MSIIKYILGGLLCIIGGVGTFFFISEFSVFGTANLEWFAIPWIIVCIIAFLGGVYIIVKR